MGPSKYNTRRP